MGTDPSQQLSQQLLRQGMPQPSSMVSFTEDEIAKSGGRIEGDREHMSGLLHRTGTITLGFTGASGYGLNNSHDTMRDQKTDTYNVARQVLKSWYDAFQVADARYVAAEDESKKAAGGLDSDIPQMGAPKLGGLGAGGLGAGGMPGIDTAGLKTPGLGMPGGVDPRLNDPGLGTPDIKQPDLNSPDLKQPDLKTPDLKTPDLQQPDLNQPDLNNPGLNQPDLKTPDLQQPDLDQPDLKSPELTTPGLDQNGLDPSKTSLADYQPSVPSIPTTQPPGGGVTDPGRATVGYGTPGAGYTGTGSAGVGAGAAGVNNVARALAGSGAGGMPMMPMMPGGMAGGRADEKEKSDSTALRADEAVWEGDEDIAPAVLSHEDV
ncbi:hypothetical protein MTP10_07425 [Nonomuraea sp. 3-1Str]|uniref:hypothetical protein n=1 Tax=Nonomuraea sp. 3-1Str TaxID=2929801 RepID=UPI00285F8DC0|nr:hypothetical protein [Nonomuraea sp. 3-1Str]MDR8408564.1 hypothetical protein [Nonomuraea sp. 3-1Str]